MGKEFQGAWCRGVTSLCSEQNMGKRVEIGPYEALLAAERVDMVQASGFWVCGKFFMSHWPV